MEVNKHDYVENIYSVKLLLCVGPVVGCSSTFTNRTHEREHKQVKLQIYLRQKGVNGVLEKASEVKPELWPKIQREGHSKK